jgi:hypothetical protein
MTGTPAYRKRRDQERSERLNLIRRQRVAGTLIVRKLTSTDVDSLETARRRRLNPAVTAAVAAAVETPADE